MRLTIAIVLTLTISLSNVFSQTPLDIIGPGSNGIDVCAPWCQEFELYLDPTYQWQDVNVILTPQYGGTITLYGDSAFLVCIDQPGTYYVEASGLAVGPNGEFFASDSFFIFAQAGGLLGDIYSNGCPGDSTKREECHKACEFSEVTYTVGLQGQTVPGFWLIHGAQSYTENFNSVDVIWGAAGAGTVTYSVIDWYCEGEVSICVDILPTPEPDFNSLPEFNNGILQLCTGQPFYLENLTEHASRYEWTFGDGTTSELFEPEHSYSTPGFYTLTLTAYNVCECEATRIIEVEVLPAPAPELSCVATVCPDDKVRYVASTDGCQTFFWTVSSNGTVLSGGGLSDDFIEVEWGAGPDGLIELLVDDCNTPYCDKPAIFRVPIVSENGPISGDALVCSGELVTYSAPYFPGVTYDWSVTSRGAIVSGQNTNAISIQWSQVNSPQPNESVDVTYGHCYLGCQGSDQFDVSIVPNMSITAPSQFCENDDGLFQSKAGFGTQTDVSSNWLLIGPDGSQVWTSAGASIQVTIPLIYPAGDYTIIAVPDNANAVCQDQVEHDFIITALPNEPLGIVGDSFICPGLPYAFESINAGDYQTHWVVTDGGSTTLYQGKIITHTFGVTPPYLVEAAHGDLLYPACQSNTISKIIFPAANAEIIGADEQCLEENTIYEVYNLPGNILEWRVEPSDMAEVSNKNSAQAGFYWVKDGVADVILSVCGQDIIKNVIIHPLPIPVVNFPAGLCKNEVANVSTTFDFESQVWRDTAGTVISMDSSAALLPGYYSVDVTDVNGCVGTTFFEIEFYPTPTARISTLGETGHCAIVDPIELVANTDGVNYNYQWLRDGMPVGANSPKFMADTFGWYQVEATNQYGCSVLSNLINVFDWCDPNNPGVCQGRGCVIYGDLEIENSEIDCNTKTYDEVSGLVLVPGTTRWYIENSNGSFTTYTDTAVEHTYVDAGYYTVIVTAELDGFMYPMPNCEHLVHMKDTVELAARFDYHGACANGVIAFEDLTTFLPDFGITNWAWDFGDSGTSSDQHPDHVYTSAGEYIVTLVATSTSGCTSTVQQTIEVYEVPTLTILSIVEACQDNPVQFEVTSNEVIFDISWDFLDPSSSNNSAESAVTFHAYENAGQYFPSVMATNIYTCTASTSTSVEIFTNNLAGDITSTNGVLLCEGEMTELSAPAGGIIWDWNTDEITDKIIVGTAGHYDVLVEDDHGCQYAPDPIFIEIQPKPIAIINGRELFGPGDVGDWTDTVESCQGVDIELMTFANSNVTYSWSTTATNSSISFTGENNTLLAPGEYTFSVVITDVVTNCVSDPAEIVVIVHDNPQDFTVSIVSGSSCSESTNVLQVDNVEAGVIYTWSDGQEGSQIEATEAGLYTVVATNEFGCTTSSINAVFIKPSPRADLIPSGCFIRCNPDTICIPQIDNVSYFEIRLDNVVVLSGSNLPGEYIATLSGSYEFYLESFNGCSALSEPLNLELYPGFGHVDILVFVDVNSNGMVDAGDTTITGIDVQLFEGGILYDVLSTNNNGSAYFLNVPSGTYTASIDSTTVPAALSILITDQIINVVGCDLEFSDTLALSPCLNTVDLMAYLCPGDSLTLADTVFYPTGDFNYFSSGQGLVCDTLYQVTILPDTVATLVIHTYFDLNENGFIDLGDSLVGTIPLILTDDNSTSISVSTNSDGELIYQVNTGNWLIEIDTTGIPFGWTVVIGSVYVTANNCDELFVDLLMGSEDSPISIAIPVELCAGDSVLIDGTYYYGAQVVEEIVTGGVSDTIKTYTIVDLDEIQIVELFTEACEGEDNGAIEIQANSANGPVSISWNHTAVPDFILSDLSINTYEYSLNDGKCTTSGEIVLGEYIFPALDYSEVDPRCFGSSDGMITVSNTSPELSWSIDNVNFNTSDFIDLEAGTYTVYFTNGNCIQTEVVTLDEKIIDPFDIVTVVDLPINSTYQFNHNYLDSLSHVFNWSPATYLDCQDCPAPIFLGAEEDVRVLVMVTDQDGCEQAAEILLRADQTQHIYIPNAFSPNDDAVNDRFKPFVREGVVATTSLEIFDRWGNRVYQEGVSTDASDIAGWDGRKNGDYFLPGLFIYKAAFIYTNGNTKQVSGEVHLVR